MSKLSITVTDIMVLNDDDIDLVSGGGGTLSCSKPCQTTCNSDNCNGTTGSGAGSGCRPTSNQCQCPNPREDGSFTL